jgi:hypothetical protein
MRRLSARARAIVAVGAAALALGACGLATTGTGSSEASPDGDTTADATNDASVSADGATTGTDATDSATATDAITTGDVDAALDGGGVDAADAGNFCTTVTPAPTFCEDFDRPAATGPGDGWNYEIVEAGSTVAWSTSTFKSAPRSLHASSTLGGAGSVSLAFSMVNKMVVDFDVLYESALPGAGGGDISPILLTPPTFPGFDVYFYAQYNASYFQEYGNTGVCEGLGAPSLGVWHHISITVNAGTTTTMDCTFDATTTTNKTLPYAWALGTTARLQIGLAALYQVSSSQSVYVDNVVVRVNQ